MSSTPYLRSRHFTHLEITYSSVFKNSAKPLCILHRSPTFPSGFLFGLPPSLKLAAARVLQSTSFRYLFIRFLTALPHSVSNSVGLRCFPSFFHRTCCLHLFLFNEIIIYTGNFVIEFIPIEENRSIGIVFLYNRIVFPRNPIENTFPLFLKRSCISIVQFVSNQFSIIVLKKSLSSMPVSFVARHILQNQAPIFTLCMSISISGVVLGIVKGSCVENKKKSSQDRGLSFVPASSSPPGFA